MVESSPVLFSVFLTSFFISSAQDSGRTSRKKHNKCLPVIFLMMVRPVDDIQKKWTRHYQEQREKKNTQILSATDVGYLSSVHADFSSLRCFVGCGEVTAPPARAAPTSQARDTAGGDDAWRGGRRNTSKLSPEGTFKCRNITHNNRIK